jgi:hypothetical protein
MLRCLPEVVKVLRQGVCSLHCCSLLPHLLCCPVLCCPVWYMWVGGPIQLLPDTVPSLLRLPQPLLPMGNSHKQGVACDERQERHRSCEADVPLLLVSMEQRVKGSSDTGAGHNEHTHKHTQLGTSGHPIVQ